MIVIGLTGNYGMGKSMVARMFGELGAFIIDADEIVHKLIAEPEVIEKIKTIFGEEIVKGNSIDKKLLADMVFKHSHLRISLEDIIHPLVFKQIEEDIKKLPNNAIVIVEAPVLFERGYQNRFDKIITVYSSEGLAISRLKEKGISEEDARMRLRSQFPVDMKLSRSDFIIDNNGSIDNAREQVKKIYEELRVLS